MTPKQMEKLITKKLEYHLASATNYVSAAIKNKRKKQNLTQFEITKGYCDTLTSKVEGMKIIPSDYLVEETGKAFNLPLTTMKRNLECGHYLKQAIRAFYDYDFEKLQDIHRQVSRLELEMIDDIYHLFIVVLQEDGSKADIIIERCMNNLVNMDYFSGVAITFLSAYNAYNKKNYKTAKELIDTLQTHHAFNDIFKILQHGLEFKIYLKLNHYALATQAYLKVQDKMKSHLQLSRYHEYQLHFIEQLNKESSKRANTAFKAIDVKAVKQRTINQYFYTKLIIQDKSTGLIDATIFDYLNHNHKNVYYYQALIILDRYATDKLKSKIQAVFKDITKRFLFEFIIYTTQQKSKAALIDYINLMAFPMAINHKRVPYIEYYGQLLVEEKIRCHRYKEAFFIQRRYQKALKNIQST